MTTVVISPSNVANFPDGGGHFWVYMQYAQGLRRLGCDVYWLERFRRGTDRARDAAALSAFFERMARFGLGGKALLYVGDEPGGGADGTLGYLGATAAEAAALFRRADLLLNFHYAIAPEILGAFARTALVDIDPGLLQFWIAAGQLAVPGHDLYFTTGETVGTPAARFPDCGLPWVRIRPPICLDLWPAADAATAAAAAPDAPFSTISSWWGGGAKGRAEWIVDGAGTCYDNCKRVSFLAYASLPSLTSQPLELALNLSADAEDVAERRLLERMGWRVRHSREVSATPEAYGAYVRRSRGEFSCAKPSCMHFQNAWVSDRTLCYLASGRPVVVQDTGPSAFLPNGEGMFRFSTLDEAAAALAAVGADYGRHRRAAREIAEAYFDARPILTHVLDVALGGHVT
jgi:hypothetical protein